MSKLVTRQATKEDRPAGKRTTSQATQQDRPANTPMTRREMRYQRRQERQHRLGEERKRAVQRKRITIVSVVATAVLLSGILGYFVYMHATTPNIDNHPAPSPTAIESQYPAIDGISCDSSAHKNFDIQVHLTIYIHGIRVDMPNNIGVAPDSSCLYWLHTPVNHGLVSSVAKLFHGVIQIEAPAERTFTLGNFLDIWAQRFSLMSYPSALNLSSSPAWKVYVNGQPYTDDFHTIPLTSHVLITLADDTPGVRPDTYFPWTTGPGA